MSHRRTHLALSLFVVLLVGLSLLPGTPAPFRSPIAQAAGSPLAYLWSALALNQTYSLAWGDVDGDGALDLVVGNLDAPNQLYRNQGGTLVLDPTWTPAAQSTYSVAWGDVNGDGALDLVVGNKGQPNQLYRNQGGTLVLDPAWAPVAQETYSVAWGDVNGDGALDLVVGNKGQPNQLYRNQGGTLVLDPAWLPTAQDTTSVAWGDVDGDGDLDLAVGNNGQSNQLYRNKGGVLTLDSTWAPAGLSTYSLAWGDVDGDGRLDLLVGNYGQPNQLYRNQSGSLVLDSTWAPAGGQSTLSVAWGDVDGDGDLDLAVGNATDPNDLYINQGGTLVLDPTWTPAVQATSSVAWGDVDGDGALDLAAGNINQANLVYRNQANTLTADPAWAPGGQLTNKLAWGDVDGDGDLDLAVGNHGWSNQLYINQNGTLVLDPTWSPASQTTTSLAWGDVDGDGDLDLAVGNYNSGPNQLYINNGGVLDPYSTWFPDAQQTNSLAWGDVDGDGDLDLAVGNGGQPNQIYINNGGVLTLDPTWTPAARNTLSLAWGDVDGDGDLDLVVGNGGQPNQLYRNQGGVLTLDPAWTPAAQNTNSVAWGDVDGDGDLDLAVGNNYMRNQIYRNQGGTLVLDTTWTPIAQTTMSVAWGDADGDGDLDLAVGNNGAPNQLYRNQGGTLVLDPAWTPEAQATVSVAWGDVDGDGGLDLAVGNKDNNAPSQIYRSGVRSARNLPANPQTIAIRQPDAAGATGSASADFYSAARIVNNRQITIPFSLANPEGNPARAVRAQYSLDGGGNWKPVLPAAGTVITDLATLPERFPNYPATPIEIPDPGQISTTLTINAPANGVVGTITDVEVELTIDHPYVGDLSAWLTAPDGTIVELFGASLLPGTNISGLILDDQATMLMTDIGAFAPFTGRFRPSGSLATLNGKSPLGQWTLNVADQAAPDSGAIIAWALRVKTTGVQHTFTWNMPTAGIFGQSDNAVLRMVADPTLSSGRNGTPLFQHPFASAMTFPFRVRGTQVRVVDSQSAPQTGAMVFRLNDTLPHDQQLFASAPTALAFITDANGYLGGRGELLPGDQLVALAPVALPGAYANAYSQTVRLFATNMLTTTNGVRGFPVTNSGVQTVTVSLAHPLALFDLRLSLEWDARYDTRFMTQLQADLARASELLFQATHGQAALGSVTIFQDRENWDTADIRIYASNRVRPSALIGGVAGQAITDTTTLSTVVYGPGQVRMGAIWNRFGNASGNLSEDWPRTLVHELGHYLFFLEDNYLGLQAGKVVPVSTCPGLMSDTYAAIWQYQTSAGWGSGCAQTFSNQTTGRADWTTIHMFYPALVPPTLPLSTLPPGPIRLPLTLTEMASVDPLTPTVRLDVPIFYTVDGAGGRVLPGLTARAYLFQHSHGAPSSDYTQIIPLGRANNDQVLARGARVGDRLCLFEPTAARFGCETIAAGNEQVPLTSRPDWQPDIQVTPVTSRTLEVRVTGVPTDGLGLRAALYPLDDDPLPTPITLSAAGGGVYTGTFTLAYPLLGAYIHLQTTDGPTPTWETVTSFAMGGNAGGFSRTGGGFSRTGGGFSRTGGGFSRTGGGFSRTGGGFSRTGGAPVSSAEGDVLLVGDNLNFTLGQFLLLQTTSSLPTVPTWTTLIGQGYRFTTSSNAPDLTGSALSFSYLDSDVPTGEETGMQVYYRSPTATAWQPITTTLDTYFNLASIPTQGPGLYALMSSIHIPLPTAGWNNISYPVPGSREVGLALSAISGKYQIAYSYVLTDTLDPWKIYAPAPTPAWVSDLPKLNFGQGYWIYATEATDLLLKGNSGTGTLAEVTGTLTLPPATVYGTLANVLAGQVVEARAESGAVCGRSTTQMQGGQVVFVVKVAAAGPSAPACGTVGSVITVTANGKAVGLTRWDNTRAVNLSDITQIYISMIAVP